MLSQLRKFIGDVLSGAAESVAPKEDKYKVTEQQEILIEDLIRYPPQTKGIPIVEVDKIISSQFEMLRLMHRDSGYPDPLEYSSKKLKISVNRYVKCVNIILNLMVFCNRLI